jgi:hypothetical protein
MEEDDLENHCSWCHLNQQACLAAMEEDELENNHSRLHLYQQDCFAVMEVDELENHCSWRQDSHRRRVTALQEAGQSLSNNAGEVMSLHMVLIPSTAQLSIMIKILPKLY